MRHLLLATLVLTSSAQASGALFDAYGRQQEVITTSRLNDNSAISGIYGSDGTMQGSVEQVGNSEIIRDQNGLTVGTYQDDGY